MPLEYFLIDVLPHSARPTASSSGPRRRRISAARQSAQAAEERQRRVAGVMPRNAMVLGQVADLACAPARLPAGRPSSDAPPPVARTMPSSTLMSVVLPAPLGPSRPKISPRPTSSAHAGQRLDAAPTQQPVAVGLAQILNVNGEGIGHGSSRTTRGAGGRNW